jgi:hypothetical protein
MKSEFGGSDTPRIPTGEQDFNSGQLPLLRVSRGGHLGADSPASEPGKVIIPPPDTRTGEHSLTPLPRPERPTLSSLIGNEDIYDILDNRLVLAPYQGASTEKYFVTGMPEVVVRHTPNEPAYHKRQAVADAVNSLSEHGIAALPYVPVDYSERTYVVTRKVHGVNLEQAAGLPNAAAIAQDVDGQWSAIVNYIRKSRSEGLEIAADILGHSQHMYGRIIDDPADKVRLVDLGSGVTNYSTQAAVAALNYEDVLRAAAHDVVELERFFAQTLPRSREAMRTALEYALEVLPPDDPYAKGLVNISRLALSRSVILNIEDDDAIEQFGNDDYYRRRLHEE